MLKLLFRITFLFLYVVNANAQSSFFVDDAENVYKCTSDAVIKYKAGETEGIIVAGGNGRGGAENQLDNPSAVIVDEKENIYICDRDNHRIQKWEKGAKAGTIVAGGNGPGSAANQLNYPNSLVFDSKGNMIVGDLISNIRIQKWKIGEKEGLTVAGGKGRIYSENQLFDPRGAFILENDTTLLIVDSNGSKIIRWIMGEKEGSPVITRETDSNIIFPVNVWKDKYGDIIFFDGESGPRFFFKLPNRKTSIPLTSPKGYLFVRNGQFYELTIENKILKFNFQQEPILGQHLTAETIIDGNAPSINNQFQISPGSKFTQDKKGNIYVIETAKDRILKANADGKSYSVVAGGNGKGDASNQLNNPQNIVIDDAENIYVVDTDNHRIQKFEKGNLNGVTVAGGNGYGGNSNQLAYPYSVAFDSKGNLIIADQNNNRIQKWKIGDKEGITIAGGKNTILDHPVLVFVDEKDNVYTAGADLFSSIQKWNNGQVINEKFNGIGYVRCFVVDKNENIFFIDFDNNVKKWSKKESKEYLINITIGNCNKLTINENGDLLISDSGKYKLIKINSSQLFPENNLQNKVDELSIYNGAKTKSDSNQLDYPQSVFLSDSNNFFVFDSGNDRIQKFKQNENVASGSITEDAYRVFVDKKENAYTLSNDGVRLWDFKNTKQSKIVAKPTKPLSLWVSNNSDIYITNYGPMTVEKWKEGAETGKIVAGQNGGLYYPHNLVLDKDSTIYVYNAKSETIQKWDSKNNKAITIAVEKRNDDFSFGNAFNYQNLFVDFNKNLYTLDNDKILKWKPNATSPEYVFGQPIDSNSKMNSPQGFTIAPNGDIYIADTGNNRILKVNPNVKLAEKSASQKTLTEYNGAYFLTPSNELIAKIIPDEANLAMGEVTASVHIDTAQSQGFVKRRYKIETNDAAHKSQITLYFTQADFDAYNQNNTTKLPTSPTDKAGIAQAQLIATKSGPVSSRLASLKPRLLKIKQLAWNDELKLWALTFDDSGSNEYWLQTKPIFKTGQSPHRPVIAKNGRLAAHEEAEINQILLYPNPATDRLTVQIDDKELLGTEMKLVNEIGQTITSFKITQPIEQINVVKLKKGMYFLIFVNGKSMKFIRE